LPNRATLFVDVLLPLAIPKGFTYRVPFEWNELTEIGKRVVVEFGRGKKQYAGIILKISEKPPTTYQAKYIEAFLDEQPIVNSIQLQFWKWISSYYLANLGEVMTAALPGGLRLASESRLVLHPEYQNSIDRLSDDEYLVVEALEVRNVLSLSEISEILNVKFIQPKIKSLIEKKAILVEEEIKRPYRPKMVTYVRLTAQAEQEEHLKQYFDQLESAPRQLEVLMCFIQLNQRYSTKPKEVKKSELQKVSSASSTLIKQLVEKGIFEFYEKEVGRLDTKSSSLKAKKFSSLQSQAYQAIMQHFKQKEVVLLHGITSSGKTELYIRLIEESMKSGKQVLYLLPEIALTTQIVQRLQAVFGEKVGVYHSRFNENERLEVWNNVLKYNPSKYEDFQLIIGARSALFLPFSQLGLVIIDEEHENTFKQYDPAPRYQARDAAIVLAKMHEAKVLLGSATPSIESYYNASRGKYGLVELNQRHGGIQPPEIIVSDIKTAQRKKKMKSHFSEEMLEMIENCLKEEKQVILFQNRRGYAPVMVCETCGNFPQCKNCDVTLTYHKFKRQLNCHYCGYHTALPNRCPSCGDSNLKIKGFGTEKIEEELAIYLKDAKIARMDLDTTRAKKAYEKLIHAFEEKQIDILVGTQMVTKGLNFEDVGLVGILNADNMLFFPDFRAFERSYQLMSQVAGRAGRKGERGKVLIQTYNPDHQIIKQVIESNYQAMFAHELQERRNFQYPPFYRLIKLTLKHRDQKKTAEGAAALSKELKIGFGGRVLGPEPPAIGRIKNFYLQQILLKLESEISLNKSKKLLSQLLDNFMTESNYKSIRINIDVDPF